MRFLLCLSLALLPFLPALSPAAEETTPRATIQFPELSAMPDRTEDFRKQIAENGGTLLLEAGVHRITGTLEFALAGKGSAVIRPVGGRVTLIMDGPGPAIRIVGSHEGSASPKSFQPATWNETMPLVEDIEIVGNHAEADGIELVRTVEPILSKVSVRWCRTGIRLFERNRNVTISNVNLYENSGIGLYLDDVNLHQINVANSHISYNRGGGIVVRDGNVRNLHITGCDIEANMPGDDTATTTANILLDVSGSPEDKSRSIAEVAITGCTIQHSSNYSGRQFDKIAPGGANIRFLGKELRPIDSVTISGNVLSDAELNIDLHTCLDITLTGNTFFAPNPDNLHVTNSKRVIVNGNTFNPREFERPGRIVFDSCQDCIFSNNTLRALLAEDGAVHVKSSTRMSLTDNLLTESSGGIRIEESSDIVVKDWIVSLSTPPADGAWISKDEASSGIVETGNIIAK
ncbi:MAG: right-handed parallel beta-helix repeat-containing protein [Verrucomicrobiaceae bacterium]|nr:right-handed parallel beta-helix repeat-containing protein [Verrucomicrobiaceae bacterium]